MHLNYGGISKSHAGKDCVWHIILDAELYSTCPGGRVLVVMTHQVQCNFPIFEAVLRKNMHLFLERCRRSHNVMVAFQWRTRRGAVAPRFEKFWTNSVFRASSIGSKILKDKKYFNTVKSFRATLFFRARQFFKNLNDKKSVTGVRGGKEGSSPTTIIMKCAKRIRDPK